MDNYVVVDKSTGKQIGEGFKKKKDAKAKRNELQAKTKAGIPETDQENMSLWTFKVSHGKDHPLDPRLN